MSKNTKAKKKESTKKYKEARFNHFDDTLLPDLEYFFDVQKFEKFYKITSRVNDRVVDYYPLRGRTFLIKEFKWGTIQYKDLMEKLLKYLKTDVSEENQITKRVFGI